MTTLAVDTPRTYELGVENHVGAVATDIIYEGSAVGDNASGYARPLNAGDKFLGFCLEQCDNSTGAAGAKNVWLRVKGQVQLAVGSLAITDVGKAVYASDDATFTLTESTNSYIGTVKRFVSTGVGIVAFDATRGGFGYITPLTDSTTGTASDTLDDTTAGQKDDIASLAAKINSIIKMLND